MTITWANNPEARDTEVGSCDGRGRKLHVLQWMSKPILVVKKKIV